MAMIEREAALPRVLLAPSSTERAQYSLCCLFLGLCDPLVQTHKTFDLFLCLITHSPPLHISLYLALLKALSLYQGRTEL